MTIPAIAAASAAGTSLTLSIISRGFVPVGITRTIVSVGVCFGHENIRFVLYRSMC